MVVVREAVRPPEAATATQDRSGSGAGLLAAGGLLGALAASTCCILPLVLITLGAGGAWIGNLSALAAYQPIFVTVTVGFLGTGFYLAYRKPAVACAEGAVCARPRSGRLVRAGLWGASVLTAAALGFPYFGPYLLGIS